MIDIDLVKMIAEYGVFVVISGIFLYLTIRLYTKIEPTLEQTRHEVHEAREEKKLLMGVIEQNTKVIESFTESHRTMMMILEDLNEDRKVSYEAILRQDKVIEVVALDTKDTKELANKNLDASNRLHTEVTKANAKMELIIDELHIDKSQIPNK